MALDPEEDGSILEDENASADYHDQAELTESLVVPDLGARIKLGSYDSKGDHNAEMNELACSFIQRINSKPDIIEDNLKPGEPENGEEAHV